MARTASPLRYPGGKSCLYPLVSQILKANRLERKRYAEPFAGGCGLALSLLYEGHVGDIHINDVDASIWAFWHSVLDHTEDLTYKIGKTPITIEEWQRQRKIHLAQDISDPVELGFLGPVEIHWRIIVAPMWIMASKLVSVLQRAIRLNSLSF